MIVTDLIRVLQDLPPDADLAVLLPNSNDDGVMELIGAEVQEEQTSFGHMPCLVLHTPAQDAPLRPLDRLHPR